MGRRATRDRQRHVIALALGGAFLGHAVMLAGQDAAHAPGLRVTAGIELALSDRPVPPGMVPDFDAEPIAVIALDVIHLAGLPVSAVAGPGDAASFDAAHPMPAASADLPGTTAADRGGGAEGGAATWTGRRDPDQTALRSQLWNGADAYRAPRRDIDRRAATSEAIARAPDKEYGDRQARALARAGDPPAPRGDDDEAKPTRADGATQPTGENAMVDRGATATDVTRHGKVGDDVSVAAASAETDPDPFDLTPARAGGDDGEGVRGTTTKDGALADGRGTRGTAATRAGVARGSGGASVFASRTDPYLRELLRRLDREIKFPRDLKLDLRSGRVIAVLTLRADGTITDVAVATSSGYQGFDDELTRAIKKVGALGEVPSSLLDGARSLKVMVPYTFRNPMIR
jgi:TonB family protein